MRRILLLLLGISLGTAALGTAHAQYPAKPVRMVIPFPPGGATDIVGRVVAQKLAERWGQPVVAENRPGAGGTIGSDAVAKSAPDGYTLLIATTSTHAVGPVLQKLPYDPLADFTAITLLAHSPNVLVVSPQLGAAGVRDVIAAAKAKPGQLTFASSGNGTITHLTGELFRLMAGVEVLHVPYKGTALSIPDIAANRVSMLFDNIVSAQPHIRSGAVRPIAVTTAKRSALMPDLPTMSESGLPGFESSAWFGLFAPAALPAPIRARVHEDAASALNAADARERLVAAGADPAGEPGEALERQIRADMARWGQVIRAANVKPQ
jgi:tripartite-type tricarboxylate transporter receptor subunit TctC